MPSRSGQDGRGPLSGLRVLEFGQIAAGPYAGSLLADLGADVVKVERPGVGDEMRTWPPVLRSSDGEPFSGNFAALNRNKRSFQADLKDESELKLVKELCASADVLIENFRPGTLGRLGLGYEDLATANPTLIYCSISGYGQTGPNALRGAFDVTVQAASGVMSCTGEENGEPVKVGVPIGDFAAGLYAAYTVMAACHRGGGAYIDCSLLGSLLGISALQTSEYFGTGRPAGRLGSAHPRNAPYQAFHARDRSFALAAGNEGLWRRLCVLLGQRHLISDPRFETQELRAKNQRALAEILEPIFAQRDLADWLAAFDSQGIPCAPINTFADALSDEHVLAMRLITDVALPNNLQTPMVGFPVKLSGYEFTVFQRPPRLGEHNLEVCEEWLGSGDERRLAEA